LYRLEAATSRLEDLAVANTNDFREAHAAHRTSATPSLTKDQTPQFNTGVFTPETRTSVVEEPVVEEPKSPVVVDYEKLIADLVDPWAAKSEKIGQVVGEQVSPSSFHIN
jgi:Adenylate cyclase associated (CAP) N terminal